MPLRRSTLKVTRKNLEKYWLYGCTCDRPNRISVHWDDGHWILMKHHGHSEWVGGFMGQSWCGTYYDLFRVGDPFPELFRESDYFHHEGRLTAEHWRVIHAKINDVETGGAI